MMVDTLKAPEWMDRCDDCGWPLHEDRSAGCHEFDCSFRPQRGSEEYKRWKAGQSLTFMERKQSRAYIRQLECRIKNLESESTERGVKDRALIAARNVFDELAAYVFDETGDHAMKDHILRARDQVMNAKLGKLSSDPFPVSDERSQG